MIAGEIDDGTIGSRKLRSESPSSSAWTSCARTRSRRWAWRSSTWTIVRDPGHGASPRRSRLRSTRRSRQHDEQPRSAGDLATETCGAPRSSTRSPCGSRRASVTGTNVRFMRGNLIFVAFVRGRWDDALEGADAFIAECEAVRLTPRSKLRETRRDMIRLARGDHDGALPTMSACSRWDESVKRAEGLVAGLADAGCHAGSDARGWSTRPATSSEELVPLVREHGVHARSAQAALFASPLDVPEDLRAAIADSMGTRTTLWQERHLQRSRRRPPRRCRSLATIGITYVRSARFGSTPESADRSRPNRGRRGRAREGARVLSLGRRDVLVERAETLLADAQRASA